MSGTQSPATHRTISVYPAEAFRVINGINHGEAVSASADVHLGDIYCLSPDAAPSDVDITQRTQREYITCGPTTPRKRLYLDCTLSFMAAGSSVLDIVVFVQVDDLGFSRQVYLMPLATLKTRTPYSLVAIDLEQVSQKFASVSRTSFAQGSRIALGSGRHKRVEELRIGDAILTRDNGVQSLRKIGSDAQRAIGKFAPVRIRAGALNNAEDVRLIPDHSLLAASRNPSLVNFQTGCKVRAKHLIDGKNVVQQEGGFVDYYHLQFDQPQIIYVEGIAAAADGLCEDEHRTQVSSKPEPVSIALNYQCTGGTFGHENTMAHDTS